MSWGAVEKNFTPTPEIVGNAGDNLFQQKNATKRIGHQNPMCAVLTIA